MKTLSALAAFLICALTTFASDRLTSKPAPAFNPPPPVKAGDEIRTAAGQVRRVGLPGGVSLFVNQNTSARVLANGDLSLTAGEVYADVDGPTPFTIKTPARDIQGRLGKWAVRVDKAGTGVLVTRGSVEVAGVMGKVGAG